MKTAILTDTSCGISRGEIKALGYEMIALPFVLDEVEYDEDKLTKKEFYEKLKVSKDIHTSQAPIKAVVEIFDKLLYFLPKTCFQQENRIYLLFYIL